MDKNQHEHPNKIGPVLVSGDSVDTRSSSVMGAAFGAIIGASGGPLGIAAGAALGAALGNAAGAGPELPDRGSEHWNRERERLARSMAEKDPQ
ncbi:MAG TPA: hypothetical protein VD902_00175 [Symbiobacteriaceae bacterium]|nr:hypothetical protein [Symbiobacteriaceae bacterium]